MQLPLGRPFYAVVSQPSLRNLVANEKCAGANPAYCTISPSVSNGIMSSLTDSIKAKAQAEIAKIEDAAVKEYLTLKAKSFSGKVLLITAAASFALGLLVHLL